MGTLPLYKGFAPLNGRPEKGNAGLWYDKLCNEWWDGWSLATPKEKDAKNPTKLAWIKTVTTGKAGDENPKLAWIKTVTTGKAGDEKLLREACERRKALVAALGGVSRYFKTNGRFVSGLGRSHPVENGFAWHHSLGVPYLPGSSVKGMVRAWAKAEAGGGDVDRIFGKAEDAGTICFLDAIPEAPVKLEKDVITPHYAGWSPEDPPGDWRSPTPIPFLVVASGTVFHFGLIETPRAEKTDCEKVFCWLGDALKFAGAGAKTAVGYGRFDRS